MKTQQKTVVQRIALALIVATLLASVAIGCNTAKGVGQDMEKAGEKIQDGTD